MAPSPHPSGADLLAYYVVTAETVITAGVLHVEAKEHSHCETITVWVTVGPGTDVNRNVRSTLLSKVLTLVPRGKIFFLLSVEDSDFVKILDDMKRKTEIGRKIVQRYISLSSLPIVAVFKADLLYNSLLMNICY